MKLSNEEQTICVKENVARFKEIHCLHCYSELAWFRFHMDWNMSPSSALRKYLRTEEGKNDQYDLTKEKLKKNEYSY
jgi:hypothetical protein